MSNPAKQIVLVAALSVGTTMVANADPLSTPTRDSIALPGVSVVAPYSHPYSSGVGPKASPNGRLRAENYQAPPDYVTDIAMHPYASRIGTKAGPNGTLRFEHFQVTPDYVGDVSMHPYTSGVGVPSEGGRNRPGDLQGVKRQND